MADCARIAWASGTCLIACALSLPTGVRAEEPAPTTRPALLWLAEDPESVYAPPSPPRENEGVNEGGVNAELEVRYLTDHVYRGLDYSEVGGTEDSANLQFDGRLSFNLGKLPHPFIGLFVNVYDLDPVSQFQEIRPVFGADWTIKPFVLSAGNTTYIYPEREDLNTSEVWGRIAFDDSFLWGTEKPILSPYVLGAYDYDVNDGWYLEAGVRHDVEIEDLGILLSFIGRVNYVRGMQQQFVFATPDDDDTGFQAAEVGLVGKYSLNTLFNVSRRYGEWSLNGYLFYTDQLDQDLPATDQLWGGVGIGFRY
ncbi:MAG: hypothetical protein ACREIT_02125 [Tepidisphaeraceae bacterium]